VNVALTGATGIVGRFVTAYLLAQGSGVRALARPRSRREGFLQAPEWIMGDLDDERALESMLQGADAVVHCAFSHAPGRYRGGEGSDVRGFWATNFGGTLRLLRIARACGVQRVVLMSSRAVFGQRLAGEDDTTSVDDDYPPLPDSQYGVLKRAEEQLASASADLDVCALRPTGVYGLTHPVSSSKWFDLVTAVLAGETISQSRTATEVHGEDVARAVSLLLQAPAYSVHGRAFNCSDITLSTRGLVQRVAERAGIAATLPPHSAAVKNPMSCRRLAALGWQPGGEARLIRTLDQLIHAARQG